MKEIEKEDIYIAITKTAMNKIHFIFSEEMDEKITYISNGREYGEYDVPLWIVLSGLAGGYSVIEILNKCVMQMISHGLNPDPNILNLIVDNIYDLCQDEISLVREVDRRLDAGESSTSIYYDVFKNTD